MKNQKLTHQNITKTNRKKRMQKKTTTTTKTNKHASIP